MFPLSFCIGNGKRSHIGHLVRAVNLRTNEERPDIGLQEGKGGERGGGGREGDGFRGDKEGDGLRSDPNEGRNTDKNSRYAIKDSLTMLRRIVRMTIF